MSSSLLGRLAGAMMGRLRSAVESRVVWVTSNRRTLLGIESREFALVAIIGREHFELTRRRYPIRNWRDLHRVLQLELGSSRSWVAQIGPLEGDEREVRLFRLSPDLRVADLRALCWLPETVLLSVAASNHGVLTVERDGLRYFLASNGETMVEGGAIRNPMLFALAAGIAVENPGAILRSSELADEFSRRIFDVSLRDWWSFRSRVATDHLLRFARPAALVCAVTLLVYLAVISAYLSGMQVLRQKQLNSLGTEVSTLITQQRAVDLMAKERRALAEIVSSGQPVWPVWEVAAAIWKSKGAIYSVSLADNKLSVRCSAPAATDVLEALQALRGYRNAQFASAVRQGGAGQEFVVSLERASVEVAAR